MSRTAPQPPRRRVAPIVLVVLATLLAFASIYALWIRQQVLDGPTWADTSTELVQDGQVRQAVATTIADRLTDTEIVREQLIPLLAQRNQTDAAQTAEQLHATVEKTAYEALGTARVQRQWRAASLDAQREFVRLLDGRSSAVTVHDGRVELDLRPLVRDLAGSVGLQASLVDLLPRDATRIQVMTSSDITTAQDVVRAVRGLSIVLPSLTLLLWIAALALARGHRRTTLMQLALGLSLAGVGVLLTRALAGDAIVFALVDQSAYRGAADRVWAIGTSLLRDAGIAVIVVGLVLLGVTAAIGNGRWLLNREDETALLG